jgi:hypothetical protein
MSKSVPWWTLIPTVLFTGLVVWAIGPRVKDPQGQQIDVEFPGGGKISIQSQREPLDHEVFLERLFATHFARNGILGWLREKQRVYLIDSPDLADALNRAICQPIPDKPMEERLAKAQECAAKPAVAALRSLSARRQIPFHYVGDRVLAGVQAQTPHRPGRGRANVCRTGPYVGQRLQVVDMARNESVEVEASNTYPCTVGEYPAIQLDPEDASVLFGRPANKLEEVIVVVL